jgi:hypothetical protein
MTDISTLMGGFMARCAADESTAVEKTCELALAGGRSGVKVWRWHENRDGDLVHSVVATVDESVPYRTITYVDYGVPYPEPSQAPEDPPITQETDMPGSHQGSQTQLEVTQMARSEEEGQILVTAEGPETIVSWLVEAGTQPTIGTPVTCTVVWQSEVSE